MAKVPRFAEASAGRWPIVEMDNRTATSSSISVLQQPARPNSQALRKRSGPISPCSKGLMNIPSGRPRRSRARLALRIESGRRRRSSPSIASTSKAQSCTSSLCLPECSALKSLLPSTPRTTALPSITKCLMRFFSAAWRWRWRWPCILNRNEQPARATFRRTPPMSAYPPISTRV